MFILQTSLPHVSQCRLLLSKSVLSTAKNQHWGPEMITNGVSVSDLTTCEAEELQLMPPSVASSSQQQQQQQESSGCDESETKAGSCDVDTSPQHSYSRATPTVLSPNLVGTAPPTSMDTFQKYLSEVATNASVVMSIPEGWVTRRPEDTPSAGDYNECFRLYFGLNVTVFPYIFALGGSIGALLFTSPIAVLLQESIATQLRAKEVVLNDVFQDHSRHQEINTYVKLSDALWSYPVVRQDQATPPQPVRENFQDEIVEWRITSHIPMIVRALIVFAQFAGACSFTMLVADNVKVLFSLSLVPSLIVSCVVMVVLSSAYSQRTCKYFAYVSNSCLLSAAAILLLVVAQGGGGGGEAGEADVAWSFPRTAVDLFLLLPFFTGALSGSLFALDVEGSVSDRVISRTRQRNEEGSTTIPSCGVGTLPYANDLPYSHRPSLQRTHFLLLRFERLTFVALGLALLVHVSFGEIVFHHFTSRTNCVLALSLTPSAVRTILLWVLCIGAGVCAAYNVSAIGVLLDSLHLAQSFKSAASPTMSGENSNNSNSTTQAIESVVLRSLLFVAVFVVLVGVPFFDLISSLAGAIGYCSFSLLFPAIFDLQAGRRRLEADRKIEIERGISVGKPHHDVSWVDSFKSLRFRVKCAVVAQSIVGVFLMVTGTVTAISQAMQRQKQ